MNCGVLAFILLKPPKRSHIIVLLNEDWAVVRQWPLLHSVSWGV